MSRIVRRVALAAIGVCLTAGWPAVPGAGAPFSRLVAAAPAEFTITSPAVRVANLRYTGTVDVPGVVKVRSLEFELDSAEMSGMDIVWPCPSAVHTTVPESRTAMFDGSVILDVTSLSFMWGVVPYLFTSLLPPPPGFTIDSAVLQDVTMVATLASADTLTASGLALTLDTC